jgi:hypothetical protein
MTAQQEPECIHYALCCSAQIQNASGCVGKENCKFYDTRPRGPIQQTENPHAVIYDDAHPDGIPFPEYVNVIREKAREELLIELGRQCIGRTKSEILDIMADFRYHPENYLESLRSEVKKG